MNRIHFGLLVYRRSSSISKKPRRDDRAGIGGLGPDTVSTGAI
jgi:hypothetical protein